MAFDRIKRALGKSSGGKKPKREEQGVGDSRQANPVTISQNKSTKEPLESQKDPSTASNEPGHKSIVDVPPKEAIWERAYIRLDEDIRKQYTTVLEKEWKSQKATRRPHSNRPAEVDQTTKLEKSLATTSKVIQSTRSFVDQAVKLSPEASLIWAGVCIALPLVTNLQATKDAVRDAFNFATQRLRYYIALEKYMQPGESPGHDQEPDETRQAELPQKLYENLLALFEKLLELQIRTVINIYRRNPVRGMVQWDDWSGMKEEAQRLDDGFKSDWHQVDTAIRQRTEDRICESIGQSNTFLESLLPLAEKSLRVQEQQRDHTEQILDLMQKLNPVEQECHQLFRLAGEGRDDYYESYKTRVAERVEGTCEWFLAHPSYEKWLAKPDFPLIVSADPGSGKSVLAKYLVDTQLDGQLVDTALCYFFFNTQGQSTVRQVLCALIHQLVAQRPVVIRQAILAYKENKEKLVNVVSKLWDIFSAMVMDPVVGHVVLILDALDECVTPDFVQQLRAFWMKHQDKLFLLATTRPRTEVMAELHPLFKEKPEAHISAADCSGEIASEVNIVIESRATELETKGRLDELTKDHLVAQLRAFPSQRTYLWTHAIFELINGNVFENSEDAIDEIVAALPPSVEAAYETALNASQGKHRPWMRKAFCIILAADRPLTLQEMHIAMHLDAHSRKPPGPYRNLELTLRDLCGFLVTINASKVYLLHETARDFLMQKGFPHTDGTENVPISEVECHQVLGWSCVRYFDLVLEPALASCSDDEERSGLSWMSVVDEEHHELLQYVANNWFHHIQEAQLDGDKELAKRVDALCNPQSRLCRIWTTVYHSGAEKEHVNFHGVNDLWMASFTGITALVEQIIETGDISDTRNLNGQNTVLIAALQGNDRVLAVLLKIRQLRTDLRDFWRRGPLQAAVESRNPAAVRVLLQSGMVDMCTLDIYGRTPFGSAISNDDEDTIRAFLDSAESSNRVFKARDSHGKTPLIMSCERHKTDLFWELIHSGHCDVNSQDSNRRTALSHSVLFGHKDFARGLLKVDATDANIPDEFGDTPFTLALKLERPEMVQQMIQTGKVHVNAVDKYGGTALHLAVRTGSSRIVQVLLRESADADAPDFQGWTPLMEAAVNGEEDIVQQLLDTNKVDVNRTNENGTTALFKAVNRGRKAVVELLLGASADPNISDEDGCTPLMIAALKVDRAIVSLLLESSATDVSLTDAEGRDAVWYADLRNSPSLVQFLSNAKATKKPRMEGP